MAKEFYMRTIVAGRYRKVARYTRALPGDSSPVRVAKAVATNGAQRYINIKNATEKLQWLLCANFDRRDACFVTCTFRDGSLPPTRAKAKELVSHLRQNLYRQWKRQGRALQSIYVVEGEGWRDLRQADDLWEVMPWRDKTRWEGLDTEAPPEETKPDEPIRLHAHLFLHLRREDEQAVGEMLRDNRSLGRRILDWLDGLLAKLGNRNSQERQFLLKARQVYRTALAQSVQLHDKEQLRAAQAQAWREGDNEAADAMFDESWGDWDIMGEDPQAVQFSFAGEKAKTADLEALSRAKEMREAGVSEETIRQETGWYTGMDGKWRWEIDDSTMRYDSTGDIRGTVSAKWAMEDYESARDDLWGYADIDTLDKVRAYNRADIAGDNASKQRLYDELITGPHAYYFGQYVEAMTRAKDARNAPAGGTLQDYIDHPTLFEAYPQLRNVTLRFERMGVGIMGYYSQTENEIVLNTDLRYAAEDTLVHEIQHAIQDAEGFAGGSNEEYWKQRQSGDNAVRVYDTKIQAAEKKVSEIMSQLPENVAEQFRQWSAMDDSSSQARADQQAASSSSSLSSS